MFLIYITLSIILISGILALIFQKNNYLASALGAFGAVFGSFLGLVPSIKVILNGSTVRSAIPWQIPFGKFSMLLDPMSAFFIFVIFLISGISAVYGFSYFKEYFKTKKVGVSWFMFNLLIVSMVLVCLAENALFFIISWELMSVSSFFLVVFDYKKKSVRKAGWTYLIATHIGTVAIFLMFLIYGKYSNSFEFSSFFNVLPKSQVTICLILAIVGFGTKAGIMPFHVWLPDAHPVAPSHVSALMSGVMIKTGIYAILRIASFNQIPNWLGFVLLGIGIVSGILGVLFAIAQHDLKRLLAYHSVENIGIIFLGLGIGLIGLTNGNNVIAFLGLAGGILHILNHAVFKSLLFLGSGSILHSTHTLEIDELGGLMKKMPKTGLTFVIGSASISGLPPFNGFVSEFLIYSGMFYGVINLSSNIATVMIIGIIALALIGGLATACFTKAFGTIFLGMPRSKHASKSIENDNFMTIPMIILAGFCLLIGLSGPVFLKVIESTVNIFVFTSNLELLKIYGVLINISLSAGIFLILIIILSLIRHFLLSKKIVTKEPTWDCGYNFPSEKMQYTASSFAQPITDLFHFILRTKKKFKKPNKYFPEEVAFETKTSDLIKKKFYKPLFKNIKRLFSYLRVIQQGKIQIYISYIVITLFILIIWAVR